MAVFIELFPNKMSNGYGSDWVISKTRQYKKAKRYGNGLIDSKRHPRK